MHLRIVSISFLYLLLSTNVIGQTRDSIVNLPESEIDMVEDFINNIDADEGFEFNTLFEALDNAAEKKIDLNRATVEDILELGLIDELAAFSIVQHISKFGKLLALYELQTIDNVSMEDIFNLLPYVSIKGDIDDYNVGLGTMLRRGKNELFLRWSTVLEDQKGFLPLEEGESGQRYLGSKDRLYTRYRHRYENKLSYGFTAEKDAGEYFFKENNKDGFDFYSAHFFVRNISNRVRAIAIGDFSVRFGQGLILNSGFGRGKSADAVRIKRNGSTLNAYTSVAENDFKRGAGATLGLSKNLEVTVFGSRLKRDANIVVPDTLDQEEFFFSSLQRSGFHRTQNEIDDEKSITQNTIGGNVKLKANKLTIGANVLYNSFDRPFQRRLQTYNQFLFNGDKLLNTSVDYSYLWKNVQFFGETAMSDNGAIASLNSLLISLDRKTTLALSYRNYDKKYQTLNANGFGETITVNNESGLYMGLEVIPFTEWRFHAYVDIWEHPWLRFNVDTPSTGYEYLARVTYTKRRKMEFYTQFRLEKKQRNNTDLESQFDQLLDVTRMQLRFHYKVKLSSAIELRSRLELSSFTRSNDIDNSYGYMLYQDIIYRPRFSPFSLTSRIALFDTDGYDSRIYAFENDLLYNFSIPAYFNKGIRYYLNLRYKATRSLTLEFRIAQSKFRDLDVISSGLNEIQGNTRTDLKAQVKYSF